MHVNDLAYCFPSLNTAVERTQSLNQHIITVTHTENWTTTKHQKHSPTTTFSFNTCLKLTAKNVQVLQPPKKPTPFFFGGVKLWGMQVTKSGWHSGMVTQNTRPFLPAEGRVVQPTTCVSFPPGWPRSGKSWEFWSRLVCGKNHRNIRSWMP